MAIIQGGGVVAWPATRSTAVLTTNLNSRVVTAASSLADRTINATTDGTLECDTSTGSGGSFTIFMPLSAGVTVGKIFYIVITDPNQVTIDGNGININGLATFDLYGAPVKSMALQLSSRGEWVTL